MGMDHSFVWDEVSVCIMHWNRSSELVIAPWIVTCRVWVGGCGCGRTSCAVAYPCGIITRVTSGRIRSGVGADDDIFGLRWIKYWC